MAKMSPCICPYEKTVLFSLFYFEKNSYLNNIAMSDMDQILSDITITF
jgi:hypothetical protein